jgi:hypothetical protein
MPRQKYSSTFEYGADISNISFGLMENGFIRIDLDYSINLADLDIIKQLLQRYKKLWLYGTKWKSYEIPDTITHLCFEIEGNIKNFEIINNLPTSLVFLSIMNDNFNEQLTNLPINLKHLEIHSHYSFKQSLDLLPIGIQTLILNSCDGNIIKNATFPPNLKKLVLKTTKVNDDDVPWHFSWKGNWCHFNIPILRNLPASLKYLYVHDSNKSQEAVKEYLPNVKIIYIKN